MSRYWSSITKNIDPYVCGEQPKDKKYIKLNTNENPYGPSPAVLEAIKNTSNEDLRLYPDPNSDRLAEAIADYYKLNKNQIFMGNGSDEILAMCFLAFFNAGDTIVFPDITYSFYPVFASLYNINYKMAGLNEDFSLPVKEFLTKNGGVVIANPNAPTGKTVDVDSIKEILNYNSDKVVIIDEAYIDFGGTSVVSLINEYKNLLVIQTFSKSRSLAGIRLGFALGNEELIEGLNRIKNSFNSYTVDRIAVAAGIAAIKDQQYFKDCVNKIILTREKVTGQLEKLGFNVIPSKANFIFASHSKYCAKDIFQRLREKGVLVRYFNKERIDNYLRISIGSEKDMESFVEKVKEVLLDINRG
jgi:histidinol-phosphate aminotransferase